MTASASTVGRRLGKPLNVVAGTIAVGLSVLIVWYTFYGALLPRRRMANLVLGASVLVYYFTRAHDRLLSEGDTAVRDYVTVVWYMIAGIAGFLAASYVQIHYDRWVEQSALLLYTNLDLLVGAVIAVIVVDMTFRSFGNALGGAVVIALIYGWIGDALPGFLRHSGLSIMDLIARQTVQFDGVYGSLLQIAATWVAIFLLFAGFVEAHDGFDFINRLGKRVALVSRSGIAQSAVVSSMFIGMLTGGAAVNVALSGSFTIPLMKENQIPNRIAAAIESMASTGGQILPPVMGLAAFLIADFLGVGYPDVIVAALIPAIMFYGTVAIATHVLVVSSGWTPELTPEEVIDTDDATGRWAFILEGLQYLIPLAVLMYVLVVLRLPIMRSGGYTIGTFLLLRAIYILSPLSPEPVTRERLQQFAWNNVEAMRIGAVRLAPFAGLLGALGMLVSTLSFSGLGLRLSTTILIAGGGSFLVVMIIAMFVSLLFGLGMPTPAAYILVATVLAPALVEIGLAPMTAHLYVFYFALLSSITPPVAIACAVACEIAEADFLETVKSTLIIGGPVFAIPFLFVANPSLIEWTFPLVAIEATLISIAMIGLIFSLTGTNGNRTYQLYERAILLLLFPVIAFYPTMAVQMVGAAGTLVLCLRGFGDRVTHVWES